MVMNPMVEKYKKISLNTSRNKTLFLWGEGGIGGGTY